MEHRVLSQVRIVIPAEYGAVRLVKRSLTPGQMTGSTSWNLWISRGILRRLRLQRTYKASSVASIRLKTTIKIMIDSRFGQITQTSTTHTISAYPRTYTKKSSSRSTLMTTCSTWQLAMELMTRVRSGSPQMRTMIGTMRILALPTCQ